MEFQETDAHSNWTPTRVIKQNAMAMSSGERKDTIINQTQHF
jgi:hypothetical protein